MKTARIIITGGGSGGHVMPLIAVVEELRKMGKDLDISFDVRYFGPRDDFSEIITARNIQHVPIFAGKLRRYFSIQNFLDVPKFFLAIIQALWKIFWFMPDVVFSKGGPGALPVVIAAWFYQVPIVIHESDSVPGLTNLVSSWFARKALVGFQEAASQITSCPVEVVGNPLREEVQNALQGNPLEAKKSLGFDPEKPLLLILGGSQGSVRINEFAILCIPELLKENIQVLHQTGLQNLSDTQKLVKTELAGVSLKEQATSRYLPVGFLSSDYGQALQAADFILSRAGAGTLAEIAAAGKPSFLIPLPESANDHQRQNAYAYGKAGAAIIIEEENLLPNLFMSQLHLVLRESDKLKKMQDAARQLFLPDAARKIAEVLLHV